MRQGTRAEWADRVKRWRASEQTSQEFAARELVNPSTLLWWSSRLLREGRKKAAFVEVASLPPALSVKKGLEVVVRERVRIRVSEAFDPELLRQVVAALEER